MPAHVNAGRQTQFLNLAVFQGNSRWRTNPVNPVTASAAEAGSRFRRGLRVDVG